MSFTSSHENIETKQKNVLNLSQKAPYSFIFPNTRFVLIIL